MDSGVQILSGKFLESTFICIKPQVHILSEPAAIVILAQRPFLPMVLWHLVFGLLARVSCWVQFGRVWGLEHDPASLWSSSHTYKTRPLSLGTLGFCWLDLAFATSVGDALLSKLPVSYFLEPQPHCVSASKTSHSSRNSVHVLLVLASSSIACRTGALVAGHRAPQDYINHKSWCISC
jgi:hypothetical protein